MNFVFPQLLRTGILGTLLAIALTGCEPSEGSKQWCERLERKAMSLWSMRDTEVFYGKCVPLKKREIAEEGLQRLKAVLELLRLDIGRYPTDDEGLKLLIIAPTDPTIKDKWQGPYLKGKTVPLDPWGKPYRYSSVGKGARINCNLHLHRRRAWRRGRRVAARASLKF